MDTLIARKPAHQDTRSRHGAIRSLLPTVINTGTLGKARNEDRHDGCPRFGLNDMCRGVSRSVGFAANAKENDARFPQSENEVLSECSPRGARASSCGNTHHAHEFEK